MRRIVCVAAAMGALVALGGCSWGQNRAAAAPAVEKPAGTEAPYLQKVGVARQTDPPLPSAVESALVLQDKYARALEDLSREQQRSRDVAAQNQKLAENAAKLQTDLTRTQQELAEANTLLVQMRQELEKWKTDVLGFRDELRRADQAQLEALVKVLTLLGGETPKPAGPDSEKPTPAAEDRPPAAPKEPTAATPKAPPAITKGTARATGR